LNKLSVRYAVNLGRILRKLFGVGKPRALQGAGGLAVLFYFVMILPAWLDTCGSSPDLPALAVQA
jgi:hypothetical protein